MSEYGLYVTYGLGTAVDALLGLAGREVVPGAPAREDLNAHAPARRARARRREGGS